MGNTYADRQKDYYKDEDLFHTSSKIHKPVNGNDLYISESKARTLVKGGKPGRTLILKLMKSETCENWFFKRSHGLGTRIPKHLVSLDEKYLRRCLELIHKNASKEGPCRLSINLSSLDMGYISDYATIDRRNSIDVTNYAIDYPMAISPVDEGIVGSIMGSNSMISIMRSPLFQRLGGTSLFDNKRCISSDYQSSPGRLTFSPAHNPGKETSAPQRSPISISSGISMITDQSSISSFSSSDSQGMVRCTWDDDGIPHFSFSLDDQKDLYIANAWKLEDKSLDYVYSFHLKPSGQKMVDISDNESDLIGKMKVSTSFSLCSNNSKVMETEFVLVGPNKDHAKDILTMNRNNRRSRKLSKVMEVFKTGHSLKQRTPSLFGGTTSTIPEDFSAEKFLESRPDFSENDFLPSTQMAAIIVKDHLQDKDDHDQKEELGGWGLNFLKKAGLKKIETSAPSECCLRNVGNCSTSMDIIVPTGLHGGPRTRNGPTGLIERWKSGHCDCGGWDIGCPLKVLKAWPRKEEGWPCSETQGDCKSFDIFIEGLKQGTHTLKMVNIHDGLYFISFQSSSLSALQCFSIAVAIIHSQSPTLRLKHVQNSTGLCY